MGGCAGDSIITIYERAMAQVWLRLEAIAKQHGVADALQALVRVSLDCPPNWSVLLQRRPHTQLLPCFWPETVR